MSAPVGGADEYDAHLRLGAVSLYEGEINRSKGSKVHEVTCLYK